MKTEQKKEYDEELYITKLKRGFSAVTGAILSAAGAITTTFNVHSMYHWFEAVDKLPEKIVNAVGPLLESVSQSSWSLSALEITLGAALIGYSIHCTNKEKRIMKERARAAAYGQYICKHTVDLIDSTGEKIEAYALSIEGELAKTYIAAPKGVNARNLLITKEGQRISAYPQTVTIDDVTEKIEEKIAEKIEKA